MSKQVDVSKPNKLSDYDLRYAFDRGLISEEVMREHMSEAAQEIMDNEAFGGVDEDAPKAKSTRTSRKSSAAAEDESEEAPEA